MNRTLRILLGAVAVGASAASAKFPPYDELPGKYPSFNTWDTRLPAIWDGWKRRFVVNGLVQGNDPAGNKRSISEGQSYGMLMAVWMGDQAAFNTIWDATEKTFWTGQWYRWTPGDNNYAGDADFDICGALIFASVLSDKGKWTKNDAYKTKAKTVLQSLIANFIDKGANYRVNSWPGAGDGIRNAAYHMPQWYPIMAEFGAANGISGMDWDAAAKGAFDFIEAQPNSSKGMARNFSNGSGGSPSGGTSSPNNYDMGFDAIRVPYRVGIAGIWYPKKFPRAIAYAKRVWSAGAVDPQKPGMYKVDGAQLWGWTEHEYEEYMTRAMWGTLAASVQDSSTAGADAFNTIRTFMSGNHVKPNIGYLAGAQTDSTCETCPARNYFGQSLGLMGALALSGRAWNVWDDLINPWTPPDTTPKITVPLTATPATVKLVATGTTAGTANISTISVSLSKAVNCTLYFAGRTSGGVLTKAYAETKSISLNWNSTMKNLIGSKAFTEEVVDIRLAVAGLNTSSLATAKTTVTLTPANTAVQPRKAILAPFAKGGVVLADRLWNAGDRVRTRVLDLSGRELRATGVTTLQEAENGVIAPLALPRSMSLRLLEVSDLQGATTARYLISPNP